MTRKAEKNRHNISRALKPRNAKLRAAVSAAVLAMSGPISTLAEVTKPIQIDLRPQRLKSALNTISETYEVPIIVPGEVLQNLDSPAVSGQLTTDEVLLIILDGSGLKANRSSSGAILISPVKKTIEKVVPEPGDAAQPAEPTTVEEIVVSGSRYYTPITNLTRSPASLSEISNSLTLISNDVIQDQLLLTLQDILLFDPQAFFEVSDNLRETGATVLEADLTGRQVGAYLQSVLRPTERLTLMGGLRYDDFSQSTDTEEVFVLNPETIITQDSGSDTALTWRFGGSYEVAPNTNVYASYSQSFLNNAFAFGLDESGPEPGVSLLEAEKGRQYEVGFKSSLFEDRLSLTGAVYDILRSNVATADVRNPRFSVAAAEFESRGLELEVAGEIIPGLNVIGAYALADGEIVDDGIPDDLTDEFGNFIGRGEGEPIPYVSRHQLSLFATYEFQSGRFEGLGFGGKIFHRSDIPFFFADIAEVDGYTTFDLTVFYNDIFAGTDLRLYVENITDEFYVDTPARNITRFGLGTNARFSLTKRF